MTQKEPLVTLKSINGHLELYPEHLVFRKDGLLARFVSHSTGNVATVDLRHVTTVQLFHPQALLNGLLIINFKAEGKDSSIFMVYNAGQQQQVLKIRDVIEDYRSRREVYPLINENHRQKAL